MKEKTFLITNEKYHVKKTNDPRYIQVVYSFVYRDQPINRFYNFVASKKNNIYYIAKARAQVAREKENGKLEKYTKNYFSETKSSLPKKFVLYALCPILVAGTIISSVFVARHFLASRWHEINDDKASEIVKTIFLAQKYDPVAEQYDVGDYMLFDSIYRHGGEFKTNLTLETNLKPRPYLYLSNNTSSDDYQTLYTTNTDFSLADYNIYFKRNVNPLPVKALMNDTFYLIYRKDIPEPGIVNYITTKEDEEAGIIPEGQRLKNFHGDYSEISKQFESFIYENEFYYSLRSVIQFGLCTDLYYGHFSPLYESFFNNSFSFTEETYEHLNENFALLSPMNLAYYLSTDKVTLQQKIELYNKTLEVDKYHFYSDDKTNSFKFVADLSTYSLFKPINPDASGEYKVHIDAEMTDDVCTYSSIRFETQDSGVTYHENFTKTFSFTPVEKTSGWESWPVIENE